MEFQALSVPFAFASLLLYLTRLPFVCVQAALCWWKKEAPMALSSHRGGKANEEGSFSPMRALVVCSRVGRIKVTGTYRGIQKCLFLADLSGCCS